MAASSAVAGLVVGGRWAVGLCRGVIGLGLMAARSLGLLVGCGRGFVLGRSLGMLVGCGWGFVLGRSLGFLLGGSPVGHALATQFGQRFVVLSALLLSALSPTAPALSRPNDRDLVNSWLERNDAQNYVVLGDPAVRIRTDALA